MVCIYLLNSHNILWLHNLFALFIGATAVRNAFFGQGTGPIQVGSVQCSGRESTLLGCSHILGRNRCGHFNDAGVRCAGMLCYTVVAHSGYDLMIN